MKIITIWNLKGGVGKSTTSINLAYNLSRTAKVLVMDLDPQNNTTPFFAREEVVLGPTVLEVLNDPGLVYESIKEGRYENLDYIKGSNYLTDAACDEQNLRIALGHIAPSYDYLVIDCRTSAESLTRAALNVADIVLTPILLDGFSKDNLSEVRAALQGIESKATWKIFINRYRNTRIQRVMYDELETKYDYPFLDNMVSDRIAVQTALAVRKPVATHRATNIVAADLRELTKEIVEIGGK